MSNEDNKIISLHAGYDHAGDTVDGYIARPIAPGTHPAVVLISGMSGLNPFQREMTRVFARAGFVTLSPDLFDGYSAPDHSSALLAKNSLDINATVDRLAAASDWLRQLPWVEDNAQIGVIGFCLGGGLALLTLGRTDAFGAGVIYYQSLFPDPAELAGISTKLQCHYGTADKSTPAEEVDRFRTEIDRLSIKNEVHFYQGLGHSFLNPSQESSSNRNDAAELSLERTFKFLHQEVGNPTVDPEAQSEIDQEVETTASR
jgi:carboxymethylenebutenolidase